MQTEVAPWVVGGIVHEDEVCQSLRTGEQAVEGVVTPHVRAGYDKGRFTEHGQSIDDASPYVECADGFRRIRKGGAESGSIAERFHDLLPQPGMVHDQLAYPLLDEALDAVLNERASRRLHQYLGTLVTQRAHALSASRGQDHRSHGVPSSVSPPGTRALRATTRA